MLLLKTQRTLLHSVLLATCIGMMQSCLADESLPRTVVARYCIDCHNNDNAEGGLDLKSALESRIVSNSNLWEKVVRKLNSRQMPPLSSERPPEHVYASTIKHLTDRLDASAAASPTPGPTPTLKRLNRTEYQNAVRDLLDLQIDASDLLPADESSAGFDHTLVRSLSPTLVTRYLIAARKIAKQAVGTAVSGPTGKTFRIKPDVTQEKHVLGLPLGTRGGGTFLHHFPETGIYNFQVRLTRDRNDEVEGLNGKHELVLLVDDEQHASLTVSRPSSGSLADFDDTTLRAQFRVPAGPRELTATFLRKSGSLQETIRQPLNVHYNLHRHPRLSPAIYEVSVTGPHPDSTSAVSPPPGDSAPATPSQKRIFLARPNGQMSAEAAAKQNLSALARRAYRREVTPHDMPRLLKFFNDAHASDGFDAGIEAALAAILTSPHFLLKLESDKSVSATAGAHRINDFDLASRLSFFLWSSCPDDTLLDLAANNRLHQPDILSAQIQRMLANEKAGNLATNFAGQWLQLRDLDSITPNARRFPDFDENLRQAMRRETELHIESMITENRSVLDLLQCQHTFLNERLAKHYGIPGIQGSRYRLVELGPDTRRGGLLRQASILTITSYATRTSPVVRGNWVLENILGAPVPPPPNDVPALETQASISETATLRERLLQHRQDPTCARCHDLMDPIGFALENFDAVGRWRDREHDKVISGGGQLPNGQSFSGVHDLEEALLTRPELFAAAFTEKLLTFALGRGIELHDGPAIRKIVRDAKSENYSVSAIVLGIARSVPFQLRMAP